MTIRRHALAGIAALAVATLATPPAVHAESELQSEIATGQKIAPVKLTMPLGVDPRLVYLGAYIVEAVATCNGCHSNKEYTANGNPFNGQHRRVNTHCYMNGGQAFGPTIASRNVTPDASGKPAGLTLAQFKHVFRTGEDPQDPGTLLQVMPWDGFQFMTDLQLEAVYAYLSSIPSLPDGGSGDC